MAEMRIEPPSWFTDLKDRKLLLLIYGEDIQGYSFSTNIPYVGDIIIVSQEEHSALIEITLSQFVEEGIYRIKASNSNGPKYISEFRLRSKGRHIPQSITPADCIYLIVTDRFAKGNHTNDNQYDRTQPNVRHGGDIKGITRHLDYIAETGFTAIWPTPLFRNNKIAEFGPGNSQVYDYYHGYAISDFFSIDPHFGTVQDYHELVNEAHRKGIKVIADFVFNHIGDEHPWLKNPPMSNWINNLHCNPCKTTNYNTIPTLDPYASECDLRNTVEGWFTRHMADLNLSNPYVVKYLTQMAIWWIAAYKLDAIRLDTFLYSDKKGMQTIIEAVCRELPTLSIIAETWMNQTPFTAETQRIFSRYTNKSHPLIVMDFALQSCLTNILSKRNPDPIQLYELMASDFLYKSADNVLAFIDNHDLPRMGNLGHNNQKIKLALGLLLTLPRIPQFLYGDEFNAKGKSFGDGPMRIDFPGGFEPDDNSSRFGIKNDVYKYVSNLLDFRRKSPALTEGRMIHFIPENGVYSFFRIAKDERIAVMANLSSAEKSVDIRRFREVMPSDTQLMNVVNGSLIPIKNDMIDITKNEIIIAIF